MEHCESNFFLVIYKESAIDATKNFFRACQVSFYRARVIVQMWCSLDAAISCWVKQ
jgi:hypothetical protein